MMELFPNLPEDLGRECLLRVSFKYHNHLKAVCTRWRDEVNSWRFYQDRRDFDRCQEVIIFLTLERTGYRIIMYDPVENWWGRLPRIPKEFKVAYSGCTRCVSLNHKLVVLGFEVVDISIWPVCIYDFCSGKWYRAADMPQPRYYLFDCWASPDQGLVYVAGGHYKHNKSKPCTAVYSVEEDKWSELDDEMATEQVHRFSGDGWVFVDGKKFEMSAFEQSARIWASAVARFYESECPCVAAFGRLYLFHPEGVKVTLGPSQKDESFNAVEQYIPKFRHVYFATLCGDSIFVTGDDYENGKCILYLFRPLSRHHTAWTVVEPPELCNGSFSMWSTCSIKF